MIAGGTDVATVAGILGHSQPSTTLDIYTHAFDKNKGRQSDHAEQSGNLNLTVKKLAPVELRIGTISHKKSVKSYDFTDFLVRPTGFEPAAYRVGVCHSIQLSYGRIFGCRLQLYYYTTFGRQCKENFLLSDC